MPKPIPVAIRRQIVERHQSGETLKTISKALEMPYESVRTVWRLYRSEGRINPNYGVCGQRGARCSQRVYRAALFLKRLHPTWGATLIREVILDKWCDEKVPHARSLQRWFRQVGIQTKRMKRPYEKRTGRGKAPHNVWEMDSREAIRLATQESVSWLMISDEASGAILDCTVFPPRQSQSTERSDGETTTETVF